MVSKNFYCECDSTWVGGEQALPPLPLRGHIETHTLTYVNRKSFENHRFYGEGFKGRVKIMQDFEKLYGDAIKRLMEAIAARKVAELAEKKARNDVMQAMHDSKMQSFDSEQIQIRIIPANDGYMTIDVVTLMKEAADEYNKLLERYPKEKKGAEAHLWVKVKNHD